MLGRAAQRRVKRTAPSTRRPVPRPARESPTRITEMAGLNRMNCPRSTASVLAEAKAAVARVEKLHRPAYLILFQSKRRADLAAACHASTARSQRFARRTPITDDMTNVVPSPREAPAMPSLVVVGPSSAETAMNAAEPTTTVATAPITSITGTTTLDSQRGCDFAGGGGGLFIITSEQPGPARATLQLNAINQTNRLAIRALFYWSLDESMRAYWSISPISRTRPLVTAERV